MADTELRANSLRIRFNRGLPEPTDSEIFKFMKTKMNLNSEKLLSMYKDKNATSIIIKFKTDDDMRNSLCELPETMVFNYDKHESTEVKLSSAKATLRYVRLFNLPPEVEDREISAVMVKYGAIVRMIREKYGEGTGFPIWTSVRGVYIELKEGIEIPATLYIRNLRARVFYEGQVNKCYLCGSKDHLKAECPGKKSVSDRLQQQQGSSYSGILKSGERWINQQKDKTIDSGVMVNLGQGLPKRATVLQQQSIVEDERGAMRPTTSEVSHTASMDSNPDEQLVANNDNEMCIDSETIEGASEVEFTKVVGKRCRKQKPAGNNKNSNSDSDESPKEKVHREETVLQSTVGGSLSESLDRVTRSKAKQKVSDQGESSSEIESALNNTVQANLMGDV